MRVWVCVCGCACVQFYTSVFSYVLVHTHKSASLPPFSISCFISYGFYGFADLDSFIAISLKLTIDDFGIYILFLLIYRCCILLSDY